MDYSSHFTCMSPKILLLWGQHYSWKALCIVLDGGAFFLPRWPCVHAHRYTNTGGPKPWCQRVPNDGEDQMPASIPFRSVSKSTRHRAKGLVYLSTACDSLTGDHVSVILCFGEKSSTAFIHASLSRDETRTVLRSKNTWFFTPAHSLRFWIVPPSICPSSNCTCPSLFHRNSSPCTTFQCTIYLAQDLLNVPE